MNECIDRESLKSKITGNEMYTGNWVRYLIDEEPTVNGWISVKDRLPEEHGAESLYLVCVEGTEYPFRAFFDGENWGDGISKIDVTYWMELPEPPKESIN